MENNTQAVVASYFLGLVSMVTRDSAAGKLEINCRVPVQLRPERGSKVPGYPTE